MITMTKNREKLIRLIFLVYIAGVLTLTFVVRETMVFRHPNSRGLELTPFREFDAMLSGNNQKFWFMQIFLNILLFVPFGTLLPVVAEKFRNFWFTTILGFLFSGAIESMQYITGRGFSEVDDLINNTAGAAAGYIIFAVAVNIYRHQKNL
jgi:glycopeptide antibiotics resistance protein